MKSQRLKGDWKFRIVGRGPVWVPLECLLSIEDAGKAGWFVKTGGNAYDAFSELRLKNFKK